MRGRASWIVGGCRRASLYRCCCWGSKPRDPGCISSSSRAFKSWVLWCATVVRVAGLASRDLLSKGCGPDLHPEVFRPAARHARTLANCP